MPRLSSSQLEARRTDILRAALRCFSKRGFERTAMTEIAAEAEVAVGTLYSYFENKQGLLRSLAEFNRQTTESFVDQFLAFPDPVEAIERLIESSVQIMEDARAEESLRIELQLWASALSDKELRRWIQDLVSLWEQTLSTLIQRGQDSGEIDRKLDPAATGRTLFALINGLSVLNVMGANTNRKATIDSGRVAEVVRALLNGLR